MTDENFTNGYEMQKRTAENLFAKCKAEPESIKKLCEKHAELINDFEYVKELNRVMTERFDSVIEKFPTAEEIDLMITRLSEIYGEYESKQHYLRLMSFRKIIVALANNSVDAVRPKSYQESVNSKVVNND
jgi:tRNA C32,U32 (ribose-2'-O)-methylase TrmJ